MKKTVFISAFLLFATVLNAQTNNEVKEAKRDANRELNNGIRTGTNAGDKQKVNDARAAKESVRNASTSNEVRQSVKDYRSGSSSGQTPNRKPNSTGARRAN